MWQATADVEVDMFSLGSMWPHGSYKEGMKPIAGKARTRPSFKKNTRRYKEVVAPAKVLEGQRNLTKKRRYASRHPSS
jgi:hypothetical protein